MRQLRNCDVLLTAGLLGAALLAGTRGARAGMPSLPLSVLPSFLCEDRPPMTDLQPLPLSSAFHAGTGGIPGVTAIAADALSPGLRWGGSEGLFVDGYAGEAVEVTRPSPFRSFEGAAAALVEIRAAESGSLSLEDEASAGEHRPSSEARPAREPARPLLPDAPAAPDPRALLAAVALPAWGFVRPVRRRRTAGAISHRLIFRRSRGGGGHPG